MQGWYWFLGISSKQQHMLQDPTKVNEYLQTTNKKIGKLMLNQTHFIQQHVTNFDCISQSTKQKIIILKGYAAPMP